MIDTSFLPQSGEPVILPDTTTAHVAWCSGWTWPIGDKEPTRYYAQALTTDGRLTDSLRVIPAVDIEGRRFWLAERRTE